MFFVGTVAEDAVSRQDRAHVAGEVDPVFGDDRRTGERGETGDPEYEARPESSSGERSTRHEARQSERQKSGESRAAGVLAVYADASPLIKLRPRIRKDLS